MALDIPSSQLIGFALDGTTAARRLSRAATTTLDAARGRGLGDGIAAGRFVERSVTISAAGADQALRQSIYAANAIRGALGELAELARLAAQDGLVSENVNLLSADGTRISRGNIQTQINRALGLINNLVNVSGDGNANFIDGSGPVIRLQTSRFGGAIKILPQGLDSTSLGLANLDVSTSADARLSAARLENAISTAGIRLERLTQLQSALGQGGGFNQALVATTADISGTLPIGAFVNLSA